MGRKSDDAADRNTRPATSRLPGMVGFMLRRAQLAVFRDFLLATEEVAVTPAQFSLLTVVSERPGLKQTALSEALDVKRANLVSMLDAMESRGLVVRRARHRDARSHAVEITPAGQALLQQLDKLVAVHEARITQGLDPAERDRLNVLLQRIIDNCNAGPS